VKLSELVDDAGGMNTIELVHLVLAILLIVARALAAGRQPLPRHSGHHGKGKRSVAFRENDL
jgi:hypothetical protein